MLDFSNNAAEPKIQEVPVAPQVTEVVAHATPLSGALARHYKGGLYRVEGSCTIESSLEVGVLYRAVDPLAPTDLWLRPVSDFFADAGAGVRFTLLDTPDQSSLRKYLPQHVISDTALESILRSYDEPWRFFHNRNHLHELFSLADARKIDLTQEQAIAVLFHDIVYVPGAPEGQNEQQSVVLMQVFKHLVCAPGLNWTQVSSIIEDTATHKPTSPAAVAVLDLDLSSLGADPLTFCVADEKVWLENRHLLSTEHPRKDFDTRRLRFLLNLAEKGPLFSEAMGDLEIASRRNLEGLRLAWVQKYAAKETTSS